MPQKKSQEIDNNILLALALGESNKSIAQRFNVSTSYVSKVKTGKKIPSCKVADPTLITDGIFTIENKDIEQLTIMLNNKDVIVNKQDIIKYVESKMKEHLVNAKICQLILNNMKGDKNAS